MTDRHPTLAPRAKPAKTLVRAVLLAAAASLLGLGAPAVPDATAAPVITRLSPDAAGVGEQFEIIGSNFGATQGSSLVHINKLYAPTTSWSDTSITVTVPWWVTSGDVVVTVGGEKSNGVAFTIVPKPVITQLSPDSGAVGTSVTIYGNLFGTGGSVTFNGTAATTTNWSDTLITAIVPAGATTGDVVVTVGELVSKGVAFTVTAPTTPIITQLNPRSGEVGTSVTIYGHKFGTSGSVTFNGTAAATTNWSDTSIRATVPVGATTGNVVVTVNGVASNGVNFTVTGSSAPSITGLSPGSGTVGTAVTITGTNFGTSGSVTFNGTAASTTNWRDTSITATVPAGAETGDVVVTVNGVASNGVAFTVIRKPVITRLDPPSGEVGTSVTITGTDFGTGGSVTFNGTAASTTNWSDTSITATVPAGATTGDVVVTVNGVASDGVSFTVTTPTGPSITSLDPAAGAVGTSVTITGTDFGTGGSVTFNGTAANTTNWSATSITATVPAGARTGDVVVTAGGVASNGVSFAVTGVTVDPTELTVREGGTGTYTVVLDSKPASAVTVSMFTPGGTDLSVDILPVFTPADWDEPQTVTVTAGEDEDRVDDTDTIVHRTASADAGYHDLTVDSVEVTVTDNDAGAGVRVDPVELTIEEGGTGTYTVVLNQAPSVDVTVAVTAGGDLTVDRPTLTFTALDWETAQTVTVTAGEDEDAEDETEIVTHAVTSADTAYSGLAVESVKVTIADDEGAGGPGGTEELTVSTTRLRITEGNMGTYTVVLNRAPAGAVTVAVGARPGSDLTVGPSTLDFTTTNWDQPQEVTVEAGQDDDLADEVESITHTIMRATASSSSSVRGGLARDAFFATMSSPAPTREYVYLGGRLVAISAGGSVGEVSVVVTIDDDDDPETPGVPALTNSLTLTEGHTGAYTLELGAEPRAEVTITLAVSPGSDGVADVTVSPSSLAFTASNWDTPQWITVSVGRDADTVGETETISHAATSADSRYHGIKVAPVRVVIRDRNRTGPSPTGTLRASPNPCGIWAGQTTCSTTLTWTSQNTTAVHLRRTEGANNEVNEVVVRSGSPNGNTISSEVGLTASTFILYDYSSGSRERQLATVTVKGVKVLSLDPTSGPVGREVTICGPNFGAIRGTSTVTFNGTPVTTYTSWSDTEIVVEVPAGATTGDVVVTVNGAARTVDTFTVNTAPFVSSVSPTSGEVGTWVTVSGWNFGATQGTSTATWQNYCRDVLELVGSDLVARTATAYRNWTDTSFEARVPTGLRAGNYAVMVRVGRQGGNCNDSAADFTVTGTAEVTIESNKNSCTIPTGRNSCSVTLSWSAASVARVKVRKGSTELSNSTSLSGTVTGTVQLGSNTFVAEGYDSDGKIVVTDSVTVTGERPPPGATCDSFRATPANICSGGSSTLRWTTTGADSVSINRGIGDVDDDGSRSVSPTTTTTYTLTATNRSGSDTCAATVRVWDPPTASISASRTTINEGESFTLSWTTSNAGSARINQGIGSVTPNVGGRQTLTPSAGKHTYTITASKATGSPCSDATDSVMVTVGPPEPPPDPPVIDSFTANPTSVDLGEQSTLSWTVRGATGLSINQGVGSVTPLTSGSKTVTPDMSKASTTYTLTASDGSGNDTETETVTINAPGITCSASPTLIDPGGKSKLTWEATSAKSVSISPNPGGGTPGTSGMQEVTLTRKTTYTFRATGSASRTASCTVTVKVRPRIDTFTASPSSITRGASSTLSWTTTNASSVTLSGHPLVSSADGSQVVVPWTTTTYTLTARNADGTDSETEKVTVSLPPAPVIYSLTPSQGVPDSQTTISGSNFSTTQGSVTFGGISAEINSWTATSVSVQVPGQLNRGQVSVSLTALGQTSNIVQFTVTGDSPYQHYPEECDEDEEDCEEEDEEDEEEDP